MMRASTIAEIDDFLTQRLPLESGAAFKPGDEFGEWRITALIAKGGNGEVYRVEHAGLGSAAAIKILMKEREAEHFRAEAKMLSETKSDLFPRFHSFGEAHGHLYYTMELLEPAPLPRDDGQIAEFVIAVANAADELHRRGLVHRDIKPQNILFRGKQPVLIDFGLVEKIGAPVSKGAGTRKYAAPEQFAGGEVSETIDIHALGVLADKCFAGNPPPTWARIISRSTSSIPERRFGNAAAFVRAVKYRHALKRLAQAAAIALVGGFVALGIYGLSQPRDEEEMRWRELCHSSTTNVVEQTLVYQRLTTNHVGNTTMVLPIEQWFLNTTNEIRETVVDLANGDHGFLRPIRLADGYYRIKGPGILTADIMGSGNVTMRLDNCKFNNQTKILPPENGIWYIPGPGSCLDFANLDKSRVRFVQQ